MLSPGSINALPGGSVKMRAAVSYYTTDGWLTNVDTADKSTRPNADPVSDLNGRLSFLYQPSQNFTADLRLSLSDHWYSSLPLEKPLALLKPYGDDPCLQLLRVVSEVTGL